MVEKCVNETRFVSGETHKGLSARRIFKFIKIYKGNFLRFNRGTVINVLPNDVTWFYHMISLGTCSVSPIKTIVSLVTVGNRFNGLESA